jgi:hypothetical protein
MNFSKFKIRPGKPPIPRELARLRRDNLERKRGDSPTRRELEIAMWALQKHNGIKQPTSSFLQLSGTTMYRWVELARLGKCKEVREEKMYNKEELMNELKALTEKVGEDITHPYWMVHSEGKAAYYRFWTSWNSFRNQSLGMNLRKGEGDRKAESEVDSMTKEKAIQLLKVYESQGCIIRKTAAILKMSDSRLSPLIYRAVALTGWKKPEKQLPKEDAGINRELTDKLYDKIKLAIRKGVARLVITSAQNATPINKEFYRTLQSYCEHNNAILVIIPYRYKNPTSHWSAQAKSHDWWDKNLEPHLLDRRFNLNENLVLLGDIKTQPTAVTPLAGFETISHASSAIIGHPKIELTTIATPQNKLPKILTTTGAVTVKNYITARAGKKGEHHHTFGAALVEIKGKSFHLRQLNALDDGSFMDLDKEYKGDKVTTVGRAAALVMGDTHVEFIDPGVERATFGKNGIIDQLKPEALVWHDVHDFYSGNHHHRGKVFINYVKHHSGRNNVKKWLLDTFDFIKRNSRDDTLNIFVNSNHPNDHFSRWVQETDPRTDPENCIFWAETFKAVCETARWTRSGARFIDPFTYWGRELLPEENNLFLDSQQSYLVKNIEVGYHGDNGPNGQRGSRIQFGKIGTKVIIGHAHSPGIRDGAYQVGTSSLLDLEYVKGPSSWLHTHCIIYQNGKRSLINIIDGEWRA